MRNLLVGLILAVSACTGEIEMTDPGGDDMPPPPATDVKITVRDGYTPQADVRVIFQNADDSVIADMLTDATGVAQTTMTAGNVTVIRTYPPAINPADNKPPEAYTYIGVKNGDNLLFGNATALNAAAGAIVVKVPDGQGTITVKTPCGSGQGTAPNVAIAVTDCPAMVDFYVTDADQSSFYQRAAYAPSVDLTTGILSGNLAATLSSLNVPPNTTVNVEDRVVAGAFQLFSSGTKRVDQTPATVNLPNLQGVEQLVVATIATQGMGTQMVASREAYSASPAIIDATANIIPYVSTLDYDTTTGVASWTETGTGTADAVLVMLDVTRNVQQVGNTYVRALIAPHTGMTLRVPVLPDPLYNPAMMDQVAISQGLVQATGGYDALRGKAFSVTNIIEATALDGKITLSYSGNNAPAR